MKAAIKKWSAIEDRDLREMYPTSIPISELAPMFGRSKKAVIARAKVLRLRRPTNGCYSKGSVPLNKGLRRPGFYRGRMRETQFRKGQPPHNTMSMWSFRWVRCGVGNGRGDGASYLMLKTGKPGPAPYNGWEWVHKLVWEQAHGSIPPGHRIWWKDGNHANNSLANLELVADRDHMARTTVHTLPAPLPQLIQLAAALKRKIRNKEKKLYAQEHPAGPQGSPVCDARIAG